MRTAFIALPLALFAFSASATEAETAVPSDFQQVLAQHGAGEAVDAKTVNALQWPGRCYIPHGKVAYSAMIANHKQKAGEGVSNKMFFSLVEASTPTYYDLAERRRYTVSVLAEKHRSHFSEISTQGGTVSWTLDFEKNQRPDLGFSLKKNGKLLVATATNLVTQKLPPSNGWLTLGYEDGKVVEAGRVLYACLFYAPKAEQPPIDNAGWVCEYSDRNYESFWGSHPSDQAAAAAIAREQCYAANRPFHTYCRLRGCYYQQ
jgi:hypothetical protein